jgi:hypothetical protein
MTPSEAAGLLRKSASEIRSLADHFAETYTAEDAAEAIKQANSIKTADPSGTIKGVSALAQLGVSIPVVTWLLAAGIPAAGGAAIGHVVGDQLGAATASTPSYNIGELRKLKRIQEYNKRTKEILQRVREAEERANKKPDTSVRQLF